MNVLHLRFETLGGALPYVGDIERAVIAGWTSRSTEAVEDHIRELEKLGVPRPEHTPCFYTVGPARLTTANRIDVLGNDSSGEVEFALLLQHGELWVGVGSDHTDRKVETFDISVAKQLCEKPVARTVWRFSDVEAHWDEIELKSYISKDGVRTLYQRGAVNELLNPRELIARYEELNRQRFSDKSVMFGGTFSAIGGIQQSPWFEFEMTDPVLERSIHHKYQTNVI